MNVLTPQDLLVIVKAFIQRDELAARLAAVEQKLAEKE